MPSGANSGSLLVNIYSCETEIQTTLDEHYCTESSLYCYPV